MLTQVLKNKDSYLEFVAGTNIHNARENQAQQPC